MHEGSCLCAGITYRINGDIESSSHCHCRMCQKQHGAAFGSYGNIPSSIFEITKGKKLLQSYESSPGITRTFCKKCGSTLTWKSVPSKQDRIAVTLGTLDSPYGEKVSRNIFTETRAHWL